MGHEEKMALARAAAVYKAPYFASAIYGFVFQAAPGIRTMLVTKRLVLGYDPDWAERASIGALAADIAHEVHHFVRRHFERAEFIDDPELWNIAGDLAINPDLKAAGWELDASAIFPADFGLPDGKTTEEYYDLLKQLKQKAKQQGGGGDQGQPQQGQGQGQQQGPGNNPGGQKPGDSGGGQGQQQGQGDGQSPGGGRGVCAGHCGGLGGHSDAMNAEIEAELDGEPGLGRSPEEVAAIGKRVATEIKQHAAQHGRGSLPGNLVDLLSGFEEESYIRWQDELSQVLRDASGRIQSGGEDFSLARPSKRSFMRGFIRPSMVEYLPEVAFIRDSSGSMGPKQLNDACREAYAIVQALGIDEVWFVDADTDVAMDWQRVGPEFFRFLREVRGRGGTNFIKPLEEAQKLTPYPDLVVYFTDGDGTAPKSPPPNMAVIWCVVPSYYNRAPAKWGRTVIISDDPKQRLTPLTAPDDEDEDADEDEDDFL